MNGQARVAHHLSLDEVRMRMSMRGGALALQKWLVIYNAMVDPRPLAQIAVHTGLAEGTVRRIIAEYNAAGPGSLEGEHDRPRGRGKREAGQRAAAL